jgi:thioesterase domain-containing protein
VAAIRKRQPQGPYHLAGLCFGGMVAYEAARQLEAAGETVGTVSVFDGYLPAAMTVDWPLRLQTLATQAIFAPREVVKMVRARGRRALARFLPVASLPPPTAAGDAQPMDLNVEGPEVEEETRRYEQQHMGGLRATLLVFRAERRETPAWVRVASDLGWNGRATQVAVHHVPSGHLTIVRPPFAASVAATLTAAMKIGEEARSVRVA